MSCPRVLNCVTMETYDLFETNGFDVDIGMGE